MAINKNSFINWTIFAALSFIWGSSFILMKEGIAVLTPYQVAAIRMLSGGIVLLPFAIQQLKKVPVKKYGLIILSGLLGSFFPAFLFCIAETRIDSSLAGFLNALTPIFTIIIGIVFFKNPVEGKKIPGVFIAFAGMLVLFLAKGTSNLNELSFSLLVLIATVFYAINVNMVGRYLREIGSTNIAAFAFSFLIIPSLIILILTGYFQLPLLQKDVLMATGASVILGVAGTALASIIFYVLLKRAGALFTSMVTYGIPFVALFWGLVAGETINLIQIIGLGVILTGVYIANR